MRSALDPLVDEVLARARVYGSSQSLMWAISRRCARSGTDQSKQRFAGLHVEYRDPEPRRRDRRQAAASVSLTSRPGYPAAHLK